MAHLEWLYANGWISDEDFNTLEEVYARKDHICENSLLRLSKRKKRVNKCTLTILMTSTSDSHSISLLILRKCDAIRRELLENSNFFDIIN